ncbi:hypothetical protein K438DRAFT_2018588 [Mycena galopus ATCC 62051]|nr:hypothetical protein K438DRAFT_2018588 [Mycena galopus ATCC 62051]
MRPVALGWNQLPDLDGDDSNYLVLRAPPDFKLSICENYLDRVLIGSLQVPEGKSLAAIYANRVPEAQVLTVGLWSSNASPNSNNSATAASAPSTAYAEFAIVPRILPCPRLREIMTRVVTSMNEQPTFDPPFTRDIYDLITYCTYSRVPSLAVIRQSHPPVLAKPTSGPDKSDTLARLRRHAGGVQEEFTADKGDVRVSSSADKGDVRVGSSADKGDVQVRLFTDKGNVLTQLHADTDVTHQARRGPSWGCQPGRGMGAGWARNGRAAGCCATPAV